MITVHSFAEWFAERLQAKGGDCTVPVIFFRHGFSAHHEIGASQTALGNCHGQVQLRLLHMRLC